MKTNKFILCLISASHYSYHVAELVLLQKDDELAAAIQQRGPQPESNTALWACLSRFVSHKDGGPIPVETLAANAGIFFAAGFETTAHAISWALFELSADPTLQVRAHTLASQAVSQKKGCKKGCKPKKKKKKKPPKEAKEKPQEYKARNRVLSAP